MVQKRIEDTHDDRIGTDQEIIDAVNLKIKREETRYYQIAIYHHQTFFPSILLIRAGYFNPDPVIVQQTLSPFSMSRCLTAATDAAEAGSHMMHSLARAIVASWISLSETSITHPPESLIV